MVIVQGEMVGAELEKYLTRDGRQGQKVVAQVVTKSGGRADVYRISFAEGNTVEGLAAHFGKTVNVACRIIAKASQGGRAWIDFYSAQVVK